MKDYRDIIIAPVVTEKSLAQMENENKYTFKVAKKCNKFQVKEAIEHLFDVKVDKVNISNTAEKNKRRGRYHYTQNGFKKATVTLAEGEKINIYQHAPEEE